MEIDLTRTHASLKQGPIVPAARGAANSSRSASAPQCSPLTPRPRRVFDLRGSLDLACHRVFAPAPFEHGARSAGRCRGSGVDRGVGRAGRNPGCGVLDRLKPFLTR